MLLPLLATLERCAADLPRPLVSEAALRRLQDTAGALSLHASAAALECRLSPDERVDLLLAVASEPPQTTALQRDAERLSALDPAWARIGAFSAEWSVPGSLLAANVPVLWIELDLPIGHVGLPAPLPFLCVDPIVHGARGPRREGAKPGDPAQLKSLERALTLLDAAPAARRIASITNCIQFLPPGGRLLHVAPLGARGSEAVRLVVSLERHAVSDFLRSAGATHDLSEIEAIATLVEPCSSTITLHLDASPGVSPTIAAEVYFPPGSAQLPLLLRALVDRGAALPDKALALQTWPFEGRVSLPGRSWPVRLLRAVQLKLVARPDAPLEAKAYLGVNHAVALF